MAAPKIVDNILNGDGVVKTSVAVTIDQQSLINLCAAILITVVLIFFTYKLIIKK